MSDDDVLDDLEQRLANVRQLRRDTRRSLLTSGWPILVLWGAVFSVSVPVVVSAHELAGWYWIVTVPVGIVASFAIGLRADRTMVAEGPWWPHLVVSLAMGLGAPAASVLVAPDPGILLWWLVLVGGFAALSILDGHHAVAVGLACLAVWGAVVWWVDPGADLEFRFSLLAGALGVYLLGVGFAFRTVRR